MGSSLSWGIVVVTKLDRLARAHPVPNSAAPAAWSTRKGATGTLSRMCHIRVEARQQGAERLEATIRLRRLTTHIG